MEELAALADTATATKSDAVVPRDEAHSDTSAGSGDASEDSEWVLDSEEECPCGNEIQTSDSDVDEDSNTVATSINLNDGELPELVTRLIQEDPCDKKTRINDGIFSVKAHGNLLNQNAGAVDLRWSVSWFKRFAVSVGDVVPVVHTFAGVFTWDQLYTELQNYVEEIALRVREPRPSTYRQYLTKLWPTIRIRSPRSNVCDVCTIYWSRMKSGATAAETEAFGEHTTAARRMQEEYKSDLASVDDTHAVVIIDFSQNLTLPSVSNTPPQLYFFSLRNVNMFGVFYANKNI
ncbi:hypothetical protein L915_02347, partial [Phytophthora nicotianae]